MPGSFHYNMNLVLKWHSHVSLTLRATFLTYLTRYVPISGEVSEWNTTVVTASSPIIISEEGKNYSFPHYTNHVSHLFKVKNNKFRG